MLLFSLVLGGMFGVALLLARGIVYLLKGSLRGHHPKELLDLYLQQDDLLNSIEDGLVATDLRGQVVFANDQARGLYFLFQLWYDAARPLKKRKDRYVHRPHRLPGTPLR